MSEIAGRLATQAGAFMLEKPLGGRGVLLGGVPGVAAANVMIIGGGSVGQQRRGGRDRHGRRRLHLRRLDRPPARARGGRSAGAARPCYSSTLAIEEMLPRTDLVIGAVLVVGDRAPYVIRTQPARADAARHGARRRRDRPGRLLRDLAADDPPRPDVRGRRDHALLRHEHAGRGPGDRDARARQRDAAVRACARRPGRARRDRRRTRACGSASTSPAACRRTRRSRAASAQECVEVEAALAAAVN